MDLLCEALVEADEIGREVAERLAALAVAINDVYSRAGARGQQLARDIDGLGPRIERMRLELLRDLRPLAPHAAQAKSELVEV